MKVLVKGSKGADVRRWQLFLTGQGFYQGRIDGSFDEATHTATVQFQEKQGLVADGVVGNKTAGLAMQMGFPVLTSADIEMSGPNWPPKPDFPPLIKLSERQERFGKFRFRPAPRPDNWEAIEILDGWEKDNIIKVKVPQLAGKQGASPDGTIRFHRKAAEQLLAMCEEWEKEGLTDKILTYGGSFVPRFVRGSNTVLSNHAFGTALDINVRWNMLGATPALWSKEGCVRELVTIANKHGFYWGGHFKRLDGMHFEVAKLT